MYKNQNEMEQLNKSWRVIVIIWGAMLASLGIYLVVCLAIKSQMQLNVDPNLPLQTIKYVLFGVSIITLFGVYYLRKFLLRISSSTINLNQSPSSQNPAAGKYLVVVTITSMLLESIGIYGVVLFLITNDTSSLYQLLIIAATAMIYFRPRKDELLDLSARMKAQQKNV